MLKNILGNKDGNKEVDEEELKKLREQFKQLSQDTNPNNNSEQQNTQQSGGGQAEAWQQNQQNTVNADPQRVEENERVTNLIMQQIKELIEIDNNLNVKIKEIETKLKNNMQQTQDVKQVVDKFHQRLEFIEKNMEKFMGLYEVVTNRFNPFVEEEEKDQLDNPQASGQPSIPDVSAGQNNSSQEQSSATESAPQTASSAQQSAQANTQQKDDNSQSQANTQTQGPQLQDKVEENNQNTAGEDNSQNQQAQANPQEPADDGTKLVQNAGVKGKLDPEPEKFLIQSLNRILSANNPEESTLEKLKAEVGKNVNSLVVEAIKGHKKVSTDQIKEMIQNIENNLKFSGGNSQPSEAQETGQEQQSAQTTQEPAEGGNSAETANPSGGAEQQNSQSEGNEEKSTENTGAQTEQAEASQQSQNPENTQQETTSANSAIYQEVPQDYHFTLPDGTEVKSIADLINAIQNMDENTLAEHVNEQGNDFGQWLGLVTGDEQLAESFSSLTTREEMISELKKLG